jgi:hypothetical protein
MFFSRGVTVFILVLAFLPAVIRMVLTWRAGRAAWEVVAAGLQGANLVPLFAAFLLPLSIEVRAALFILGGSLGVWSMWSSIREYRRSKAG